MEKVFLLQQVMPVHALNFTMTIPFMEIAMPKSNIM